MTLAELLLPRLSNWRPAGGGRHTWSEEFADAGWAVHVAADKADSLSCLVWELTLTRTADAPAGLALKDWAAAVAGRVSGLVEDLKVYEVDAARDEAVLRSEAPSARGGKLAYYEVRLHGLTRAVVRRYAAAQAVPGREQVAFALTHEVLAKLAGDVAG
ncbi:MAG: hypothetical protein JWO38_2596 [Gemmataceae bacterium]|nr:hypothetical protein [Gemmataceae bacterium]